MPAPMRGPSSHRRERQPVATAAGRRVFHQPLRLSLIDFPSAHQDTQCMHPLLVRRLLGDALRIGEVRDGFRAEGGTDFEAVDEGYVSVTPMRSDLTNHAAIELLESWIVK